MSHIRTNRYRIKDSGSAGRILALMAYAVNFVWNFCKETQVTALRRASARLIKDKKTGETVAKADGAGGVYNETNERDSTRTCSVCRKVHPRIGLGVREWTCDGCGTVHDRNVNAAKNILRVGHDALTRRKPGDRGAA